MISKNKFNYDSFGGEVEVNTDPSEKAIRLYLYDRVSMKGFSLYLETWDAQSLIEMLQWVIERARQQRP